MSIHLAPSRASSKLTAANLARNESGFSLVEVMVVSSIMMVLALAMTSFFTNLSKQNDAAATKGNVTQLQNGVRNEAANIPTIRSSMAVTD